MQVFEATSTNLTELGDYMEWRPDRSLPGLLDLLQAKMDGYGHALFDGFPGAAQGLLDWATVTLPTGLRTAFELAASGQPEAAAVALRGSIAYLHSTSSPLMGLTGFITVPNNILKDMVATIGTVTSALNLIGVIQNVTNLVYSPLLSSGITAQKVLDAVEAGDVLGALGTVINAPADAVDHFLNSPGGLVEFHNLGSTGTLTGGGLLRTLLVKLPYDIARVLSPPIVPAAAASVADPSTAAGTMVSLDVGTPAEPSAGSNSPVKSEQTPASPAAAVPGPTEPGSAAESTATQTTPAAEPSESEATPAVTDTVAHETTAATPSENDPSTAVKVNSTGATDLSAGNKAEPGKVGTTSTRPGQQLRTSMENATDQVGKGLNGIRDGVEKSVSGLKDRISKATPSNSGTEKAGKGSVSRAGKESPGKAGKSKSGAGNNKSGSDD